MTEDITLKGKDLSYEIIDANPDRYRYLANGAVYDNKSKIIVKAPPPECNTFSDVDKARDASRTRVLKARQAAMNGLANASHIGNSTYDAWSEIVENQARLAMDVTRGRDSTNAATFVGKAAGFMGHPQKDDSIQSNGTFVHFSGDIANRIIDMIHEYNQYNGTNE